MATKEDIARGLLSIKAVFLKPDDPFTWASGIKSPIYCDNRLVLSYPEVRSLIEHAIADKVKELYPEAEALEGYVRGSAKDHGRKNQIEGRLEKGEKVVVIEDLISTGGSVLDCVEPLREAGAEVLGIVSIFTYGMQKGIDRLSAANVVNTSLCDLDTLVKVAVEENYIKPEDEAKLLKFRDNPSDESWMTHKG